MQVMLAASLLVNVFAIGIIAGGVAMLSEQRERGEVLRPGPQGRPIRAAGQMLPSPERASFQALMRGVLADNRDLARAARAARAQAAELFVRPQFDQAAVSAALERARAADVALRTRLETAAIGFAATLPVADRAVLAEALERRGPLRRPAQAPQP